MKEQHFDKITLIRGDCMDYMRELPDKFFDLAIVDPPYGVGETWNKKKTTYKKFQGSYKNENIPDKDDCLRIVQEAGIEIPKMYQLGFRNNNCFKTGCVQGGIGYWQKMERDFPEKFEAMAEMEHKLTALRGEPVTMLKDQSNEAKALVEETGIKWKQFIFLKKHLEYPELKCLADMKPQEVKPLFECNGFCGTNDLNPRIETENEINFDTRDI